MPTVTDTAKLLDLKHRIEKLSPADQLRLCAALIEKCEYDIAETLVRNIADELCARRLLKAPQ